MEEPVDEEPIEINYDAPELTYLYQAIEDKAFMAAIDFLESGKPEVRDECRTWITRFEKENSKKIRWSQLPLHAAIVFQAPTKVIELLVKCYPKAVRCTDDQSMLPIHLAFRKGSSDGTLHALLKAFPESVNAKDGRGRVPLQLASEGSSAKKGEIVAIFEENAKVKARKTLADEKIGVVEDKLELSETANAELQNTNEALSNEKRAVEDELAAAKEEITTLREFESAAAAAAAASPKSVKSTRSFRSTTPGAAIARALSNDNTGDNSKSAHTTATPTTMSSDTKTKKKKFFKKMFKSKKSKAAAATAATGAVAAGAVTQKSKKTITEETTKQIVVDKNYEVTPASSSADGDNNKADENPAEEAATPTPLVVETVAC